MKVFLLGAGFSKPAGFPLANELVFFIQEHLRSSRNEADIKFSQEFPNVIRCFNTSDVERFFTFLDLACNIDEKLQQVRWKLSGAMVRAFSNVNLSLAQDKKEIYRRFCRQLNEGDTIITFNYDVLVEQTLWELDKWTFLDGYGFKKNIKDFEDTPLGGQYTRGKPKDSLIRVYKLHGSLGWCYDDINRKVLFKEMPNYFSGCFTSFNEWGMGSTRPDSRHDAGTTLIEPSYIKRFDREPTLDIWKQAFQAIQKCDELIIIGYSLPEADSVAQMFLSVAVGDASGKLITVVNPDGAVFERFERTFGREIDKKIKTGLDEWLKEEQGN